MGQQQSSQIVYSKAVSEKKEGETEIRRAVEAVDQLSYTPIEGMNTLQKTWLRSVKEFGDKKLLYKRDQQGVYQGKTYKEIHELAMQLGSGVKHLNIAPYKNEYKDFNLQLVGIYAKNREEWFILDIALSQLYGMTTVPLYDSLGPENVSYCIQHSGMETCFASKESIDTLIKTENIPGLKSIVALDEITEEQKQKLDERGITIYTFEQVMEIGKQNPQELPEISPKQVFTFSYTSGTTGRPKAAMLCHENFVSTTGIFIQNPALIQVINQIKSEGLPYTHISYLPLPHVFERVVFSSLCFLGGSVYIFNGDIQKLKQDIQDVKPTIFVSVPRLYNKFYDAINKQFEQQNGFNKFLIKQAFNAKTKNIQQSCTYTHSLWDKMIFKKIREEIFGGNIRVMVSGSAPLSKDVIEFMQIIISAPLIEGYGQTENNGLAFCKSGSDPVNGHIGGCFGNLEFKLVDVPEMNYLSTDKDANGKDLPRGELCTRGPGVFVGYYKDEKQTNEAIDEDGWLHSGDIASFERETTRVRIIDRKKNIFKLSQGEYVAPEKIENVYLKINGISEVFVYGNSLQSTLVGVIVPEKKYIQQIADNLKIEGEFTELCKNEDIKKQVLKDLNAQGKQDKLFGFEQVRAIHMEPETLQNKGCYTSTMKLQRHLAKEIFKTEIDNLYKSQ